MHSGHLDHIERAKQLGDWLIVITHPDDVIKEKKGFCLLPLEDRKALLLSNRYVDEVVVSIDGNGEVAETLKLIKPDIFAKGGDRTPINMPPREIKVCEEINCKMVYGVGELLNSSTLLFKKAMIDYLEKMN